MTRAALLLLCSLLLPSAAAGADARSSCGTREPGDTRPRIGLALGGGGARGFAHVSILKELERQKVPVDCIAGTSMGALVGGLYASGMSADQIEAQLRATDWTRMFNDRLERREQTYRRKRDDDLALVPAKPGIGSEGLKFAPGVLSGQRVLLLLESLTEPVALRSDFDTLPIPFRAVATDLNTRLAVVLAQGNLAMAMRASMSIPGVFKPLEIDGKVLVDGGLANQLPVDVVRAMGADIVIAVDVGTPLAKLDNGASLFSIVEQISGFLTVGSAAEQIRTLKPTDILVTPPLGMDVSTSDFEKIDETLAIGNQAAEAMRPRLAELGVEMAAFDAIVAARPAPDTGAPMVDYVRLDNRTRYDDAVLLAKLDITAGEPLDAAKLARSLQRMYGLETLTLATYEVVREGEKNVVVVTVIPHSHGPNYLEAGLSMYSDFSGDFLVNLRLGVLRSPLNPAGGELRGLAQIGDETALLLSYYQPLGAGSRYFTNAYMSYESPIFGLFEDGERLANYSVPSVGAEIAVGREFSNFGAATLAWRRRSGDIELEVGDPRFDGIEYEKGEADLRLTYDRIDNRFLPREGTYAVMGYTVSRSVLGADDSFELVDAEAVHALAIGRHSAFFGGRYG
ncbi:MAG: patatin-like phospholipase family protein, partial [Arenimonas sp.]|nr:patatin-like phospholipase family protein [Arenimonas sp.]